MNSFFLQCEVMENFHRASPSLCTPFPNGPGARSPGQDYAAVWSDQHRNYSFPGLPAGGGRTPTWGGAADT